MTAIYYFKNSLLALFFIFCFLTHSYCSQTDSIKQLISKSGNDSSRVDLLNSLSKNYFNDNPDTAIKVAINAHILAEQINYKPGQAQALKNVGIANYLQGKYVEAINAWEQAIVIYKLLNDKKGIANMLSNEGAVFFNQGDDPKALELHLASLKVSEEILDTLRILTSLVNIGSVYLNKTATYNKALDNLLRAYDLAKKINDTYLIGTATANLGEIYYKTNKDSTAIIYLMESIKAYEGTEDAPYPMNYLGRVYVRQKKFDLALQTHKDAYEISKKLDTKLDMTQSLVALGQAHLAKGDLDPAIVAFKDAMVVGTPLNFTTEIKDSYEGLSKAYLLKNDYVNAFNFQNLLLSIKDTIYDLNIAKKLGTLEFGFQLDKKQGEVNLLTKDKELKEQDIKRQKLIRNFLFGGFIIVALFAGVFLRQRVRISKEKKRSDELLLNILPEAVAEELKEKGSADAQQIDEVTVLFTDFKGFTQLSEKLSPKELVAEINECFSAFDHIMQKFDVEKIKTIGDAYMAAGGLPTPNKTHAFDVVSAALEIQHFMLELKAKKQAEQKLFFEIRIGVHTGPVVAGIVGVKKFAYDIWGDTVNTASRMESSGEVGKVNISGTTHQLVNSKFNCVHRGKIIAKGKGEIDMYFVERPCMSSG